jgi:hypothetical protein
MHDPEPIWRFGRWIARKETGTAHLGWADGEIVLRLHNGHVVALEGLDPSVVARALEREPAGHDEILEEALAIAEDADLGETLALGVVKELLQECLADWFADPHRTLHIEHDEPEDTQRPKISITHAIVELLLSHGERDLVTHVLPNPQVVLRRADNFLELYAPLRLSEEADLVVAKITGQRTAGEISSRSSHDVDDVGPLLAALVATGMLEPVPIEAAAEDVGSVSVTLPEEPPHRRQLPVTWIAAAAAVAAILLATISWLALRPEPDTDLGVESQSQWTLVVDMGCEPEELQRVLKKARQYPKVLKPVQANAEDGNPCWRLVWGRFPSQEAAAEEVPNVPEGLVMGGFQPHPIELPTEDEAPTESE